MSQIQKKISFQSKGFKRASRVESEDLKNCHHPRRSKWKAGKKSREKYKSPEKGISQKLRQCL